MTDSIKYCRICVLPSTRPETAFNSEGICQPCEFAIAKRQAIDWAQREQAFADLVRSCRTNDGYDCVIPVSGGKDSMYQVLLALRHDLTPLCVTFETTLATDWGTSNLMALRDLGVDLIHVKRNPKVFRDLTRFTFEKLGVAQWPLFLGCYVAPVQTAVRYGIPLILWGENPYLEYGGSEEDANYVGVDLYQVQVGGGGLNGLKYDDLVAAGYAEKDLLPYRWPTAEDFKRVPVRAVYMGSYFEWNQRRIVAELGGYGWAAPEGPSAISYVNIDGIDCDALQVHDYLKYVKFGYGRATDAACRDIRLGLLSRAEAFRLVQRYDGKIPFSARRRFIDYLGIPESKYDAIVDIFTNKDLFVTDPHDKLMKDADGTLIRNWTIPNH